MNDKIKSKTNSFSGDWKDGFDANLQRPKEDKSSYQGGSDFDATLDELLFSRMIQLKNLNSSLAPQGKDPGKVYWQPDTQKYKLWLGESGGWADVVYTSTSTSSTSSSSSSSSTSSTSSSTSTT